MALNLQVEKLVNGTAQLVKDQTGNTSSLTLSSDKVGIGTTNPTQRLTLGSGNILLPSAMAGVDGNLYFGGITDVGQVGMRMFGGKVNNTLQSSFIDVRAGTLTDGLIFRVDTFFAGAERMRITAIGNVGIGTPEPRQKLEVNGNILATGAVIHGDVEVSGDIRLTNADCAEDFTIGVDVAVEPGTVMVVGAEGELFPSQQAYDKRVAGVVSGAGEYKPGIVLDKQQSDLNRQPIALVGKVYCKVDAQYGAVAVGDLLTTSPTPGRAMKVGDPAKAFGAVIGKALRPLAEGQGLIPILIALQ